MAVVNITKSAENTAPAITFAAVTPADADLPKYPTRGLYIGTTGNVSVTDGGATPSTVTFIAVPAGAILPIQVTRVNSVGSGTTATNIIALY
jgi:hypothetical protein